MVTQFEGIAPGDFCHLGLELTGHQIFFFFFSREAGNLEFFLIIFIKI